MKLLVTIFALIVVASATTRTIKVDKKFALKYNPIIKMLLTELNSGNARQSTAVVNEYVDRFISQLGEFMIQNGYDPMPLPDLHEGFEYKPTFITYHGELDLKKGWVQDVSTIRRDGDALLAYEHYLLNLKIPLAFNDLMFDYNYSAKLMNLGPTGSLDGKVKEIKLYVNVLVDFKLMEIQIQEFHIQDTGKISLKFHGNALLDWLVNLLTGVITTVLHNTVINIVDGKLNDGLQQLVEQINETINNILS